MTDKMYDPLMDEFVEQKGKIWNHKTQQYDPVKVTSKSVNLNSDKVQVGGSHYQMAIQPIDFINQNELGYCEGNIVKYAARHQAKNGSEDVRKVLHYALFILRDTYGEVTDEQINAIMGQVK